MKLIFSMYEWILEKFSNGVLTLKSIPLFYITWTSHWNPWSCLCSSKQDRTVWNFWKHYLISNSKPKNRKQGNKLSSEASWYVRASFAPGGAITDLWHRTNWKLSLSPLIMNVLKYCCGIFKEIGRSHGESCPYFMLLLPRLS